MPGMLAKMLSGVKSCLLANRRSFLSAPSAPACARAHALGYIRERALGYNDGTGSRYFAGSCLARAKSGTLAMEVW